MQGVADVVLSPVSTGVDSEASPRSSADASNLGGTDLLDAVDLNILSTASQTAPEDNETGVSETTIPLDLLPLLNLDVSTSSAHARWAGDGLCLPAGTPLALSSSTTAGADVLELPGGITVASLVNEQGGVSGTESKLYTTGNTARALVSETSTQIDEVTLLKGTPLELHVSVSDQPRLIAAANGLPGGAAIDFNDPLITIEAGPDGVLAPLEQLGDVLNDLLFTVLRDVVGQGVIDTIVMPLLETLGLDAILDVDYGVGVDTLQQTVADDGTTALATVSLLKLHVSVPPGLGTILDMLPFDLVDVDVDLGPMSAAVSVPQGGISCPPEINPFADLHKDAAVGEVAPAVSSTTR